MNTSELKANPKNPRTITDERLKALQLAMKEYGDLSAIVFNRKSKQLVGGHQRIKLITAKTPITIEKKYAKPTKVGTVAEGFIEYGGERFKYREVYWDKAKEMAANIAANKGAGDWDLPQLSEWLRELDDLGFDMNLTMFEKKDLESLLVPTVSPNSDTASDGKTASDSQQFIVNVMCENESSMQEIFEELNERGFQCKLMT